MNEQPTLDQVRAELAALRDQVQELTAEVERLHQLVMRLIGWDPTKEAG